MAQLAEFAQMLIEETPIPATALPLAAFKAHLQLGTGFADTTVQNSVLESFLRAACAAVEARTGKILITRDFSLSLSAWNDPAGHILPVAPVAAITAVTLVHHNTHETDVGAGDFILSEDDHRPRMIPKAMWLPVIPPKGRVVIAFRAGLTTDFADLPGDLGQAVLMLATHYYENRSAAGDAQGLMPFGVSALLERYKSLRIFGGYPA
ncbi:MAG: head-tail connector protein [Pseudomonadota bacterium]